MWTQVTAERDDLMRRYVELFGAMHLYSRPGTVESAVDRTRSSLSGERFALYHYQGQGFDTALRFRHSPRKNRYLVCMAFLGEVTPEEVFDLFYEKSQEFMHNMGLAELYAVQPKSVDYPPLQRLYDLAAIDPRIQETVLADMPSSKVLRLVPRPTP